MSGDLVDIANKFGEMLSGDVSPVCSPVVGSR